VAAPVILKVGEVQTAKCEHAQNRKIIELALNVMKLRTVKSRLLIAKTTNLCQHSEASDKRALKGVPRKCREEWKRDTATL
jgi:hypothetical protein